MRIICVRHTCNDCGKKKKLSLKIECQKSECQMVLACVLQKINHLFNYRKNSSEFCYTGPYFGVLPFFKINKIPLFSWIFASSNHNNFDYTLDICRMVEISKWKFSFTSKKIAKICFFCPKIKKKKQIG